MTSRTARELQLRGAAEIGFAFGASIAVTYAGTLLLAALTFALGGRVAPWQLAGGLALGAAVFVAARETRGGARFTGLLGWAAVVVLALVLAGKVYDTSFDGQNYHLEGVLALADGWNPFREWHTRSEEPGVDVTSVLHYPKGSWIVAAALYRATGHLETAKAFNLLLLLGAFGFSLALGARLLPTRPRAAVGWALLAAANPVALAQLSSFYVDGQMASLLVSLVAVFLLLSEARGWLPPLVAGCLVVVAVNAKLTGLLYAAVIPSALVLAFHRPRARALGLVAASVVVGAVLIGFQPYVTNLVTHGNPFYPVSTRTTLRGQTDEQFLGRNRVAKLAIAVFARGDNLRDDVPRLKVPFSLTRAELLSYATFDARMAGLGPLFGGGLLVALVLAAIVARRQRRRAFAYAGTAGILVASVLVISDGWWARLAPQLWLLPVVFGALAAGADGRLERRGALALGVVLLLDTLLVGGASSYAVLHRNLTLRRELAFLREASANAPLPLRQSGEFRSVRVRLAQAGVRVLLAPRLACEHPIILEGTYGRVRLCLPAREDQRFHLAFRDDEDVAAPAP